MKKWVCNLMLLGLILGCYRNHVALWKTGNPEPIQQYPYPLSVFPPQDQDSLRRGIPIRDKTELAQLMEDFLS